MSILKNSLKITGLVIFVIIFIYFSTLNAKNLDKFNTVNNVSNYFSGILLLNDNKYEESYNYLKRLEGLEENHLNYSSKYLFSLVNLGKFNEAFIYSKKLEKKKISNFESDLIIGVYYLKNKKYDQAEVYFKKLKNKQSSFILNDFLSDSLLNWISFDKNDLTSSEKKINSIDEKFKNLKIIQNAFLHCFYDSEKTELYFNEISKNTKTDFSRYNYFYASFLLDSNKTRQAMNVVNSSLKLYPRNLLLNQLKLDFDKGKLKKNFNCKSISHVVAEVFYITANALSSQNIYAFSNFYLNLSKYLNSDFFSFNSLLAENFFKIGNLEKSKKIYQELSKNGETYFWYSKKQIVKILIDENKNKKALNLINNSYKKLSEKGIYETYDYARFLKNNDQYEESIKFYTYIIEKIDKDHPLYPKVTDGRGVSYERLGEWKKAEKDLLSSLSVSPDQAYVINYLAYSWIEQGVKIQKSLKMLEKANNLKSNDPFIIDSLGWALFKLKRYQDSKKFLQTAVMLMPADPVVNDHYGDVLWKSGNRIQARYYWKYVLNLEETEDDLKNKIKEKLISGI